MGLTSATSNVMSTRAVFAIIASRPMPQAVILILRAGPLTHVFMTNVMLDRIGLARRKGLAFCVLSSRLIRFFIRWLERGFEFHAALVRPISRPKPRGASHSVARCGSRKRCRSTLADHQPVA
jgi:hypothetical protein